MIASNGHKELLGTESSFLAPEIRLQAISSVEAENDILGILLLQSDIEVTKSVAKVLKAEHFHSNENKLIYQAILKCVKDDETPNPITLEGRLKALETYDKAGGIGKIYDLIESHISAHSLWDFIDLVIKKYAARKGIAKSEDVVRRIGKGENPQEVINLAIKELNQLQNSFIPVQEERKEKANSFNELVKLSRERLNLTEVLHPKLGRAVMAAASTLPVAHEFLLQPLLAICAGIIGTKVDLKIKKGWVEPIIIWTGVIGAPGTMKSPAINMINKPLMKMQCEAEERYQLAMQQWEQDQAQWEKAKGEVEKPIKPNPRDYFVGRGTLEGWLRTHSLPTNKTGMIAIKDELRGLFNSLGQYKGGKGDDRDILLSLWNGKSDKLNNVSNDSRIFIEKTAISIVGGIQEIELVKTMGDRSDPDGLFGRFLWVNPPNIPDTWVEKEIDISPMLEDIYRNLDKLPETQLSLDADGKALYKTFVNWQAEEKENANDALKNVLSKLKGYVGRLAGLLHCIDYAFDPSIGWRNVVDCDTVYRAMNLCFHYYGQIKLIHSKTTYAELPPEYLRVVELGTQKGEVSDRTLVQKKWVSKSEDARELLQEISKLGHGRIKSTGRNGVTLVFEPLSEESGQDFTAEIESWGILEDVEVTEFPASNPDSVVESFSEGVEFNTFNKQGQTETEQELQPSTNFQQTSTNSELEFPEIDNQGLQICEYGLGEQMRDSKGNQGTVVDTYRENTTGGWVLAIDWGKEIGKVYVAVSDVNKLGITRNNESLDF